MMLRPILLVAAIAGSARADNIDWREVPGPVDYPGVATSERACNEGTEAGVVRTKSLTLGRARVDILHGCGSTPASSELAIHAGAGWFIEDGFTIEDVAGHMTDPRFHYSLVDESLGRGTLEDGSPAVVYRSISRHDMVAASGAIVDRSLVADVMVCTVDDRVRCGRIEYTCPATGCAPAALAKGMLTTIESHLYTYKP